MYVVTVVFDVRDDRLPEFVPVMLAQARNSLEREDGCLRFDVSYGEADHSTIFLYEIYRDKSAFEGHLSSTHFKLFAAETADWVVSKQVQTWTLAYPGSDPGAVLSPK